MFSLREWNFEEYKASFEGIEDPIDRHDELKASLMSSYIQATGLNDSEYNIINDRLDEFTSWAIRELKKLEKEISKHLSEREKSTWKGHTRLPYPVVWDRTSYNKVEPEIRKAGKKKEWIDWLLKNLNEGKGENWIYEQWISNAVDNEDYYFQITEELFEPDQYERLCPSLMLCMENNFIVFLFNVQKVLTLKEDKIKKRAVDIKPVTLEKNELDRLIFKTAQLRHSSGEDLHWQRVLWDLKKHSKENQTISLEQILSRDESMKDGISLYLNEFSEPLARMQISTFKRKLSQFRKLLLPK